MSATSAAVRSRRKHAPRRLTFLSLGASLISSGKIKATKPVGRVAPGSTVIPLPNFLSASSGSRTFAGVLQNDHLLSLKASLTEGGMSSRQQIHGAMRSDRPGIRSESLALHSHPVPRPVRFEKHSRPWWFSFQLEAPAVVWGRNGRCWLFCMTSISVCCN